MSKQLLLPSTDNLSLERKQLLKQPIQWKSRFRCSPFIWPWSGMATFLISIQECHRNLMHIAEDADMAWQILTVLYSGHGVVHLICWTSPLCWRWAMVYSSGNAIGLALNTHSASCVYSLRWTALETGYVMQPQSPMRPVLWHYELINEVSKA